MPRLTSPMTMREQVNEIHETVKLLQPFVITHEEKLRNQEKDIDELKSNRWHATTAIIGALFAIVLAIFSLKR